MKFQDVIDTVNVKILQEATLTRRVMKSSWITSLSWDSNEDLEKDELTPETLGMMKFTTNRSNITYEVPDVPLSVFNKWKKARSYGKFFHKFVKNNY